MSDLFPRQTATEKLVEDAQQQKAGVVQPLQSANPNDPNDILPRPNVQTPPLPSLDIPVGPGQTGLFDDISRSMGLPTSLWYQREHGLDTDPPSDTLGNLTRALASSPDPMSELNKIKASEFLGERMKISTASAYANFDAISEIWMGKVTPATPFFESLSNNWKNGVTTWKMNEVWNQIANGDGDPAVLRKQIEAFKQNLIPMKEVPKFFMTKWLEWVAQSAPQMLESFLVGGMTQMVTAGTAGAMLGALPPLSLPTGGMSAAAMAAAVGLVGLVVGTTQSMSQNIRGAEYGRMIEAGVPNDVAKGVSLISGYVQGALESAGELLVGLPFVPFASIGERVAGKILITGFGFKVATDIAVKMAAAGAGEGIENSLQYLTQAACDQLVLELTNDPDVKLDTPSMEAMVKEFGNQFYQGFGAGMIFGLAGLPKGVRADVAQMNAIKRLALVMPDSESFVAAVKDAKLGEGAVDSAAWGTYLAKVYDKQQQIVTEALSKRNADEAKTGEKTATTGEVAPSPIAGPLTRTSEKALDTRVIEKGASKEGQNAILVVGDEAKSERYGYVKYETVGDTVYIREVVSEAAAQDVSRDMILELAQKNPGKMIEWNPIDEVGVELKEDLIAKNPLGPAAGINWFKAEQPVGEQVEPVQSEAPRTTITKDYFSQQMTKLFNLAPDESDAMLSLSEALAKNAGVPVEDWLNKYIVPEVGAKTPEAQAVLQSGGGVAGTTFIAEGQLVQALAVDQTEFKGRVKAVFSAMKGADFHHAVHEFFHMVERLALSPDQVKGFERAIGKLRETWTVPDVERLADLFEEYLSTGDAPTPALRNLFQQVAEILNQIISFLTQSSPEALSPELKAAYDALFANPESGVAKGVIRKPVWPRVNRSEIPLEQEVIQPVKEKSPTDTIIDPKVIPPGEVELSRISLSMDVPQFKEEADTEGIVAALKGKKYIRLPANPIVLWERTGGGLEVITGRHRFDLAKRLGELSIPSQIVREADGFTAAMALTLDAESNIRDEKGSVKDYAHYIRNTDIDEGTAESRGLLDSDKGRKGFAIGRYATDGLYSLYLSGEINETKAAGIAAASRGDPRLTAVGIKNASASAEQIVQQIGILKTFTPSGPDVQKDMFGNEIYEESDKLAAEQVKKLRELKVEQSSLSSMNKLSKGEAEKTASKYGFKAGDTRAVKARMAELSAEIPGWSGKEWMTDPAKVGELRQRAGLSANALFHIDEEAFNQRAMELEKSVRRGVKDTPVIKGEVVRLADDSGKSIGLVLEEIRSFTNDDLRSIGPNADRKFRDRLGKIYDLFTDEELDRERGGVKALFHAAPDAIKAFNAKAVKTFGTTTDPEYAAWILTDGRMLDFRSKEYGVDGKIKEVRVAHSHINEILNGADATSSYGDAWAMGALRMDFYKDGSSLQSVDKPNPKQLDAIATWVGRANKIALELMPTTPWGMTVAYKDIKNPTIQKVSDFYIASELYGSLGGAQLFHAAEGIQVDPDSIPRGILSAMDKDLRSKGYDIRGADDVLNLMKAGRVWKDGILWQPDWIAAYEKATESKTKKAAKAAAVKVEKKNYPNIEWKRVKELGTTSDLREAGYIRPDGMLVDLSGKKEGGEPGHRSFDHREVGGTEGMHEFVAYGNIRMDSNAGMIDIGKVPTSQQFSVIEKIVEDKNGEVYVECEDGLGEYSPAEVSGYGHYQRSKKRFYREYPEGTKPGRVTIDILKFYAGEKPVALFHPDMDNADTGALYDSLIRKASNYDTAEEFQKDMEETFGDADPAAADRYRRLWEAAHPPEVEPAIKEPAAGIPEPEEPAQEYDYAEKMNLAQSISDPILAQQVERGDITDAQIDTAAEKVVTGDEALKEKLKAAQEKIDEALAGFTPEEQYVLTLADELSTISAFEGKAKRMKAKIASLRGRLKTAIKKNTRLSLLIEDMKINWKADEAFEKEITAERIKLVKLTEADKRLQQRAKMYAERREAVAKVREQIRKATDERRALKQLKETRKKLVRQIMDPATRAISYRGYADRIQEIQEQIDPNTHRVKTLEDRKASQAFFAANPDAAALVPKETLDLIYSVPVQELSLAQLEEIHELVKGLRDLGRTKRSLVMSKQKRGKDVSKMTLVNTVLRGEPLEKVIGAAKATGTALKAWMLGLKPGRVAQLLDGVFAGQGKGEFWKIMQDRPNEAWSAMHKAMDKRHQSVISHLDRLKITLDPLSVDRLKGYTYLGTEMDIDGFVYTNGKKPTTQQVMFWYLAIQNEKSEAAIYAGNNLSEEVVAKGISKLTPQVKELADLIAKDWEDNFSRYRDAYIENFNEDLPKEEHYVTMVRLGISYESREQKVAAELTGRSGLTKRYVDRGSTHARIEISDEHQKPIATDLMQIWMESVRDQEGFIFQDMMIKDMHSILEADEVRLAVQQKFGPEMNKWIRKYVNDLAQADAYQAQLGIEKWSRIARSNAAIAWLSFNVLSSAKQLVGWVNALADAGPLHLASAAAQFAAAQGKSIMKGKLLGNTLVEFVEARSEFVKHRQISQELEDMRRLDSNGYEQLVKKIGTLGMKSLEVIDKVSVVIGWKAVYDKVMAKTGIEATAIKAADDATVRTQPSMRVQDMAEMYRGGEALKWFTMFTSDLNSTYNRLAFDVPAALRNGKILEAFADMISFSLAGVGIAIASGALTGDDDEKKRKRIILGVFSQYFDALPFIGNDVWSAISGKTFQSGGVKLFPAIEYVTKIPYEISQGDWNSAVTNLAEAAGFAVGLPVSGTRRAVKAFTVGEWEALLGWATEKKE